MVRGPRSRPVQRKRPRRGRLLNAPGRRALDADGSAEVSAVSGGSAGNCAAGGSYLDRHRRSQGFVVSETNGRWGLAIEVPGLAALNTGSDGRPGAAVTSVSCGSAGNCAAGGAYPDQHPPTHRVLGSETDSRLRPEVAGARPGGPDTRTALG